MMSPRVTARAGTGAVVLSWLLVALVALCLFAYAARKPAKSGCQNAAARINNGWCEKCNFGWVAGVKVKSKMLFEALDAHGHDIDPASMECQSCQRALATDGFCEHCHWGFVNQKLYFSPLTYYLARGQALDPNAIRCEQCKNPPTGHCWCDKCKRGMVGNFAYTDRSDFAHACAEYDLLLEAVAKSEVCELCSAALFYGSRCRKCKIDYSGRSKTDTHAPPN